MNIGVRKSQMALAVAAVLGATLSTAPVTAGTENGGGTYVAGDFHNHTTCSDGSISMQKLVKKSTDKTDTPWGLDWFVQAGHGGSGNRNCTLAEDATLATPAYPLVHSTANPPVLQGPTTTWQNTNPAVQPKGLASGTSPNRNMWRWQSVQEFQYPLLEYLAAHLDKPLFMGVETVVPGHEHTSASVITGQMPAEIHSERLPTSAGYTPLGNATALAQWEYCFDRNDTDTSRGNPTVGTAHVPGGNNWDCSVSGSLNAADPSWSATAQKLVIPSGTGSGVKGHAKTLEALKWMKEFHASGSYYVPAHLERAGPFNPNGNNGFNVEHLRNFNNTAPQTAFGFETQPGHGASDTRGEYTIHRNNIGGVNVDSVGGTTYGGTGVYGAQVGGVWDALLGEGRNWWFFASSDWHNRGSFGPDDRRSTQDFYPGEYQRTYVMVGKSGGHRDDDDDRGRRYDDGDEGRDNKRLSPQRIVDGLRSGNAFAASGQLIDRLAFVACAGNPGPHGRSMEAVESLAVNAAMNNADVDLKGCATMGEKLVVRPGADIIVSIVVRDPAGTNYSPYTFDNPSLAQVDIKQPLNKPVLDHVDVIRGMVSGYKTPGSADYSGQWPSAWINAYLAGGTPSLDTVPAAAKNVSATVIKTFNQPSRDDDKDDRWDHSKGKDTFKGATWEVIKRNPQYKVMTFRLAKVKDSEYLRLRGSNLPPAVPYETDADGNPLPDVWTNSGAVSASVSGGADSKPANFYLRIPCKVAGTSLPDNGITYTGTGIDGCPNHLPAVGGQKMVAYDVAAWSDLWFYSNPIYIEVNGSTTIAGVKAPASTAVAAKPKASPVAADAKMNGSTFVAQAN